MFTLKKGYEPKEVEGKWYRYWKEKGFFSPKGSGEPFVIVIPPPNITGKIHMGHGLNLSLQDFSTRFQRMRGKDVLWLPGEDHAGIATQNVVEKMLHAQGQSRESLGRDAFVQRTWEWANEYREKIRTQIESIGCSVDWSRDRFTLDEGLNRAVRKVFVELYKEGLIYKGKYLVNWCPRCHTVLSDEEVEYQDVPSSLWTIAYPVKGSEERVLVATTRPETMLGDTAVAVNPSDERYAHLVGKTLVLPLMHREIPVIADHFVDKEFGTGAVKVTPAHDPNDYQMGVRHELAMIEVIDSKGFMGSEAGKYEGLSWKDAREQVVQDLQQQGLLVEIKPYSHSVGHCYRCDSMIDPRLSDQWFVSMKPLAKRAMEVVESKQVVFHPARWEKVYSNWLTEIRDWCISRQLWWGHRIPVWYCQDCGHVNVQEETPHVCAHCGSANLQQDPDVLDTWFSSALWPFSTLGWPEQTEDLEKYYPTSLLVTGFDIIFFWVSRMIIMGLKFMDDVPFRDVYITQLIRDKKGRKMSKSLGNGIDPIEVVESYGADAMRFTLAMLAAQGRDINLDVKAMESFQHFANKIWNAARFSLMHLEKRETDRSLDKDLLTLQDQWILTGLAHTVETVTRALEAYDYNQAARALYDFFWNQFCDWYLESIKPILYDSSNPALVQNTLQVLLNVLDTSLRLMHPFMPFITEEIWEKLPLDSPEEALIVARWPQSEQVPHYEQEHGSFERLVQVIRGVRNVRAELQMSPSLELDLAVVKLQDDGFFCPESVALVQSLARVGKVAFVAQKPPRSATAFVDAGCQVFVRAGELVDWECEKERIKKEVQKADVDVKHFEKKLANRRFLENADPTVVEETRQKHQEAIVHFQKMRTLLEDFEGAE